MVVDTLTIAREPRAADLPAGPAEAIAAAIGRSVAETAATTGDLDLVRRDLEVVKQELNGNIEKLRTEVERGRNQLLVLIMSSQVALAGLLVALSKLL